MIDKREMDARRHMLGLIWRAIQQIHWQEMASPQTLHGGPNDGHTVTHTGILDLQGLGRVHAYRLTTGEAVINTRELYGILGLEHKP